MEWKCCVDTGRYPSRERNFTIMKEISDTQPLRRILSVIAGMVAIVANTATAADQSHVVQRSPIATFKGGFNLKQSTTFLSAT